jgi:hypothetical protein
MWSGVSPEWEPWRRGAWCSLWPPTSATPRSHRTSTRGLAAGRRAGDSPIAAWSSAG